MRRVAPFALVAVLLASAYPLLRGQEVRPPDLTEVGPTDGAIVIEPPAPAAKPWEYRVVTLHTDADPGADLNEAGAEGWELVAATAHPPLARYVLKRPKAAAPPAR